MQIYNIKESTNIYAQKTVPLNSMFHESNSCKGEPRMLALEKMMQIHQVLGLSDDYLV